MSHGSKIPVQNVNIQPVSWHYHTSTKCQHLACVIAASMCRNCQHSTWNRMINNQPMKQHFHTQFLTPRRSRLSKLDTDRSQLQTPKTRSRNLTHTLNSRHTRSGTCVHAQSQVKSTVPNLHYTALMAAQKPEQQIRSKWCRTQTKRSQVSHIYEEWNDAMLCSLMHGHLHFEEIYCLNLQA